MPLLVLAPQPTPAPAEYINTASVLTDLYSALNAAGPNDLILWTETELYEFLDEAAQRLARTCGVWVERDTTIVTETGDGAYNLPPAQVSTVQADLAGLVLQPRTVAELEALDATWPLTEGPPVAFIQNLQGLAQIVLYPAPDGDHGGMVVGLVLREFPPTVGATSAFITAPTCVREYFTFRALEAARGKQSKAEMPDVAQWMGKTAGMLDQVMTELWGAAS
jgi:hypothetical protein